MAGIPLSAAGDAIVYPSVPWSRRLFSLKTQSFPKGAVPRHLMAYLFKKGGDPATCARETIDKSGAARVRMICAAVMSNYGWNTGLIRGNLNLIGIGNPELSSRYLDKCVETIYPAPLIAG